MKVILRIILNTLVKEGTYAVFHKETNNHIIDPIGTNIYVQLGGNWKHFGFLEATAKNYDRYDHLGIFVVNYEADYSWEPFTKETKEEFHRRIADEGWISGDQMMSDRL